MLIAESWKMKLLYLIHRLPCPPDGGAKLRAAAQLRYLAQRHDVWCAGFLESGRLARLTREGREGDQGRHVDQARASLDDLRAVCREVIAVPLRQSVAQVRAVAGLLAGGTATEGYFASGTLRKRVMTLAERVGFDAVLAFSSSMAPLAMEVRARRRVLDLDDLDSRKWAESAESAGWPMRWVYRTEARRLARREQEWLSDFDASVLISRREASLALDRLTEVGQGLVSDAELRSRVHVVGPTLVDVAPWVDAATLVDEAPLPREPVVGFVGAMNYGPNVDGARWFAEEIWPQVVGKCPRAQWWVVGRSPARAVRRLHNGTSIRVTGTVPAVEPYLEKIRVAIAPLRIARGVQIKVLMAMTAGRPCVVTPGVAAGLGARPGRDLLVGESPVEFAEAVERLLGDDSLAETLAVSGREFVANQVRPDENLTRLERLLEPDGLPAVAGDRCPAGFGEPVSRGGAAPVPCCQTGGVLP